MSIKIDGNSFRGIDKPKATKRSEGANFSQVMDQVDKSSAAPAASKPAAVDRVVLGSGNFQAPPVQGQKPVDAMVQKVLSQPESVNSRVAEIKKLIDEGGYDAYFRSVDQEKLTQRLLDSGVFDDLI